MNGSFGKQMTGWLWPEAEVDALPPTPRETARTKKPRVRGFLRDDWAAACCLRTSGSASVNPILPLGGHPDETRTILEQLKRRRCQPLSPPTFSKISRFLQCGISSVTRDSLRPQADLLPPFTGGLLANQKRSLKFGKDFQKLLLAGNRSEKLVAPSVELTLTLPLCARAMDLVIANPSPEPSPVRCRDESTR